MIELEELRSEIIWGSGRNGKGSGLGRRNKMGSGCKGRCHPDPTRHPVLSSFGARSTSEKKNGRGTDKRERFHPSPPQPFKLRRRRSICISISIECNSPAAETLQLGLDCVSEHSSLPGVRWTSRARCPRST